MTDFTQNLLAWYPKEIKVLFTHMIDTYLKVGIESDFQTQELRELWFYIKVHELADMVQRRGYNKTLHTQLLKDCLELGGAKFHNSKFVIPRKSK